MQSKDLQPKRALRSVLIVLLIMAGLTKTYAYSFSAVCETGQTLYYNIIDANNHYVEITYPGDPEWLYYTVKYWDDDGHFYFYDYPKPAGNITLPSTVTNNGVTYMVKAIGDNAFYECSGLTGSLTIPSSVTSIGEYAFDWCTGFTGSLTISNSVTSLGWDAFYGCSFNGLNVNMTNIPEGFVEELGAEFTGLLTIGNSVTSIGDGAFYGFNVNGLSINMPNIPANFISNVGGMYSGTLLIDNYVTFIGEDAFYGCIGFSEVQYNAVNCITDYSTWLGEDDHGPFCGCGGTLTIGENVESIPIGIFQGAAFTGSLVIPNSVTSIGGFAFYGCSSFTGSLTIPNSVTYIGDFAFVDCSGFTQVNYNATNCSSADGGLPFSNCGGTLVIGNNVQSIPAFMFLGGGFTGSLTIPSSVTSIGEGAFSDCSGFTGSLTIPSSMTSIGCYAFSNCSGFTGSLTIPNSVSSIGREAFSGCSGFTGSLTIPNSVTSIGIYAFYGCSGFIGSLTIPSSVTSIGTNPFSGCSGLEQIIVVSENITYDSRNNCNAIVNTSTNTLISGCKNTVIPNSVTSIGMAAFFRCIGLTGSLAIPSSVISIESAAFRDCSGLTGSLTIPNSVTSIGWHAFDGCSGFTGSLTIPNSVTSIGDGAFQSCSGFTGSLTIPNSVTSIGPYAFYGCNSLTGSLTIGNSVTSIGTYAFRGSSGFTSLTVQAETPPYINCNYDPNYCDPFYGWDKSILVSVPFGSVSSYQLSDYWDEFTNYQEIDCAEYNIIASANPVEGGVVSGDGTYYQGQTCTLTATPNANYIFLNWSENGEVVSTDAEYSFTVAGDRDLVANFGNAQVTISAIANPIEGGAVTGGGLIEFGSTCTLNATAHPGYYFLNWTENGEVVSSDAEYTFTVSGERNLVANFYTNHWTAENYQNNMFMVGLVKIDGVEQVSPTLELGAFCNGECRGTEFPFEEEGRWVYFMSIGGNSGDDITFRLYDHALQQELNLYCFSVLSYEEFAFIGADYPYEVLFATTLTISADVNLLGAGTVTGTGEYPLGTIVTLTATANEGFAFNNWTLDGEVVSTEPSYTFTVTGSVNLTVNFVVVQWQQLTIGCNWFSTYLDISLNDLKAALVATGGTNIIIKAKNSSTTWNGHRWLGALNGFDVNQMYMIIVPTGCEITLEGLPIVPAEHPVTISKGVNWMAFPLGESMTLTNAFAGFAVNGDIIKSRNSGSAAYYSNLWRGSLNTLVPGQGYIYKSNVQGDRIFTFPLGSK